MKIVELNMNDFESFADNHPLRNYCQTPKYAKVMAEKGYNFDYIGYIDDSNNLVAASLILKKKLNIFTKYIYAPKGLLIDYYNTELLKMFVSDLVTYYKSKNYAFMKINPEIIIGQLNPKNNFVPEYNQNVSIIDTLKLIGFKRRREIYPLDFLSPRINPYINLKEFDIKKIDDDYQNIIMDSEKYGLSIESGTSRNIEILYNLIKDNTYESLNFYRNILNTFKNDAELLLVKIDHETNLFNAQKRYEREVDENNYWNEMIQKDNSEKNIAEKMNSDKKILKYKEEMMIATDNLRHNKYQYIGAALVVSYKNRVSILASGFNHSDYYVNSSYFLYSALIDRYRNDYDFLDLGGLSSNFNPDSKYAKFNEEKLAFNPTIYEFIGEFDLVLNENAFRIIQSNGILSKEFKPSHKF